MAEWIPCSERLPEKSGQYCVSGGDKVWICKFLIIPNFMGGWCNDASNPIVQAWLPLPEPYREEGLKMDELKPCPFCGCAPILKNSNHKRYKWQVRCTNMLCSCRTARWTEAQGAIDAWNRRFENVQSNISE